VTDVMMDDLRNDKTTMHLSHLPIHGTKLRLIEAAEKLFAEKNVTSVSIRDITRAANANVAAVNYHFGNRDGLVAAVLGRQGEKPVTAE